MKHCVVAVDVGNSAAKFALEKGGTLVEHTVGIGSQRWEHAAIGWTREQFDCAQREWRIASVHGTAAARLSAAISESDHNATVQLVTRHDVPMETDVDHPDRLGIDRLLGAYAVSNRLGAPAVVVDAGSAVTVDWVDSRGRFCGGAILPGLSLQSLALATGTEALPQIQWDPEPSIRLPAKNTADAMRGGILMGIAAAIDSLIQRYIAGSEDSIQVVITGGDGPAISPHIRHNHSLMPNLVCRGLFDLPRSIANSSNTGRE